MDLFLAQITASQWPTLFASFAGIVGIVGVGAACLAYASTSRDRAAIKRAAAVLTSAESWEGSRAVSEHELSAWLRLRGIASESGVADIIRTCWSAWLGSRASTLTELHNLVARREKSKTSVRLSAGIAALLLVIGIVGTLSSVKPILEAFEFRTSISEGAVPIKDGPALSNVAESTELVNSLMHSLGEAFLPSLVALISTIVVVIFRGVYSLNLNRYTLDLDRFAMGTVMPYFLPRTIADEYAQVRSTFESLAKAINKREEKFDQVIVPLAKFVDSVKPTLDGLDRVFIKLSTAADTLTENSTSIAETLTKTLGKKSPLFEAVNGFEGIFKSTNDRLVQLANHIDGIRNDHTESRKHMLDTLNEISKATGKFSVDHEIDRKNVAATVDELKKLVSKLPGDTLKAAQTSFDSGIKGMRSTLETFLAQQAQDGTTTHDDIRSKTQTTLDLVARSLDKISLQIQESAKSIPETLKSLQGALKQQIETKNQSEDAIRSVAEVSKSEMREMRRVLESKAPKVTLPPPPTEPVASSALAATPAAQAKKPGVFTVIFGRR